MSEPALLQMLAYRVADQVLLTGVSHIAEIIELPLCTSLPGCKKWFRGLASSRGNIIPVSDLGGFLFGSNCIEDGHSRLIVINRDEEVYALLVNEIIGLKKYSTSHLLADTTDLPETLRPWALEVVHDDGAIYPVLDPDLIINSELFLDVRRPQVAG
ncbi:MAG: chemotaxis protein CheW [Gammaproteobacteria bacterium]|nr:chemotaxis protein CheW [Gammaproteobacteria bacterium]